ncbi:hypothetical protein BP00DRAFT_429632 [Aspergillus indologenus CBS 114.80]|uniref:Uncharacterized protein n=1 Tax=Aspergillus indologenus CBS 114.80 TaxID=1450541 RepID=A0A2V5HZQ4_9EURO|nr:hypothetical protein BP00DRAFT_429632 [Aspergillus indologenus CBS 114.80]
MFWLENLRVTVVLYGRWALWALWAIRYGKVQKGRLSVPGQVEIMALMSYCMGQSQ